MTTDIRDARFYVVEESGGAGSHGVEPLPFDKAVAKAKANLTQGISVRVLYTEEAYRPRSRRLSAMEFLRNRYLPAGEAASAMSNSAGAMEADRRP